MIGIINVQWFDNPGAVLLCYAMQTQITRMGYSSQIINYSSGGSKELNENKVKEFVRKCKRRLKADLQKRKMIGNQSFGKQIQLRHKRYEEFRNKYLVRTPEFMNQNNELLFGYSTYIVGSDVVWKPEILSSKDSKIYFLDFLNSDSNKKRISFAASVGTNKKEILEKLQMQYKFYLDKFDYISVREQESADLFAKICEKEIVTLIDPVFLLNKEDYLSLIKDENRQYKYIYFYMLSPNMEMVSFAEKMVQQTGYKILYDIHHSDNFFLEEKFSANGKATVCDGPIEFLEHVKNAEIVITNSFHGTAFSIIFQKQFYTYSCINADVDVSVRMKNILEKFNLLYRFNQAFMPNCVEEQIDYCLVNKKIDKEKKRSIDYLTKALSAK